MNPPRLPKVWYSRMNGAFVPKLSNSALKKVNKKTRYPLFDSNVDVIEPMLTFGLNMGYLSPEQIKKALKIPDNLEQLTSISTLLADHFWPRLTNEISSVMETQKNAVREIISTSLEGFDVQQPLLEQFEHFHQCRDEMLNLELSVLSNSNEFGDEVKNKFAARLTFSDAYNTVFDVDSMAFEPRLKDAFYAMIQTVMPYQFECATTDLFEYESGWLLEELVTEEELESIGLYAESHNFDINNAELLCTDLKLSNETISIIEDYGTNLFIDYWRMQKFSKEVSQRANMTFKNIKTTLSSKGVKHPELIALNKVFTFFHDNIGAYLNPFEVGSDLDVSSQLIYSFGKQIEEYCIDEVTQRFYNVGESAALNLTFTETNLIQYFSNYSLATCMVSLLMAVIELRD